MRREAGIILAAVLALGLNGAAFAANQVAGNTGSTPLNLNDGKTLTINGQGGVSTAISQGATEGDVVVTITADIPQPTQYVSIKSTEGGNKNNDGATGENSIAIGPNAKAEANGSTAMGVNSDAKGESSLAMGDTAIATGANSFAMGTQARADGNQSLALGYRSHSKFDDGVALGSDSVASRDKGSLGFLAKDSDVGSSTWQSTRAAVSVGDPANGITRQITGVAAGSEDTDAVNVAQLKTVDRRLDKVGAMAAAFSALQPLGYDEQHPTTLSLGYGGYSGKGAVALGISHYLNRDVLLNGGMSISGEEKSFRFGASFRLGMSPRRLNADGKTVRVSSTEMEALQKVSDLEKTVNDLRKRLNALEAEKKK